MIRIFIRERKTNTNRGKCIFYMQIRRGERTEMGQKDLEGYAPESLKLIVARDPAKKFSLSIENGDGCIIRASSKVCDRADFLFNFPLATCFIVIEQSW